MRSQSWPEQLHAFIESRRHRAFEWGANDCALFACDWVKQCTGDDPARKYRNRYTTARGAARVMGDMSLHQLAIEAWGGPIRGLSGQRGDVAMVYIDRASVVLAENVVGGREALAIVLGTTVACTGPEGLVFAPLPCALYAWRIS